MKKYRVTLVRSPAGRQPNQRATAKALGLKKLRQSVVIDDNPALVGMVKTIAHLVTVEELTNEGGKGGKA